MDGALPRQSMQIRPATPDDAQGIIAITNAAFAIEPFIEGTRTDAERLAVEMQTGEFLVAVAPDHRVVASVHVELHGERGYFGMLAVDPPEQGRGLGPAMIRAAEDYCRKHGCKAMDIKVLSLRPELFPYYRRLGYVETATEEFRPSRPLKPGVQCHCVVMSKQL